jgi:hypothetical protein
VDAAEVVECEPHRDRSPAVLEFLEKAFVNLVNLRNAHPRAEIGALHDAGTHTLRVGTAHDWDFTGDLSGVVAALGFDAGLAYLDELRVIATVGEPWWSRSGMARSHRL